MASFSVDVTKIVFAGGRTGSKVVTISNAPSGGIGISNTGYGTHFRVVVKEENVSYSIETKATNSSGDSYSSTIRFYNKADSTDYVDITIVQYSAKKIAVYADNLTSTGTSGAYSLNIDYPSGSTDLYIDVEAAPSGFDYRGYAEVTSGEKWLSVAQASTAITDTGFFHYVISYTDNRDASARTGQVRCTGSVVGWENTITVTQEVSPQALTATPLLDIVSSSAGTVTVTVTGAGESDISYRIEGSWVTFDHKSGNDYYFNYTAHPGDTDAGRFALITFSAPGCASVAYELQQTVKMVFSETSESVSNSSGSVSIIFRRPSTLSHINYSISDSWITFDRISGSVMYFNYTANSGSSRTGVITFSESGYDTSTFTLTQGGGAPAASLSISPTSSSVDKEAGSVVITVSSSGISDITYTISDSWIQYFAKTGNKYKFSYNQNNTTSVRQGSITFSGGGISKTFNLTQEGQGGSDPLSVTPTELNFTASGDTKSVTVSGGTGTIAVNTGSFPSWLSITSVGNGVYNITASKNSGVSRSFDVWFTDEASTTVIVNVSQDASSVKLTVSPSSKSFGSAGGSQVFRVTYNTRINYNTLPSWLSIVSGTTAGSTIEYTMTASENTDTSSRNFNWVLTDELTTVTVPISQSGTSGPGPGPGPEPVEEGSLKVYPKKLRYYSDGGRILVSFTNKPEAGIGYSITYTDGSGWLSVDGVSPNMYVSATANDGIRRRAEIKFYDLSDNTNYVIVPVIQGSVEGYNSIWMDDLYYPENRDTSGNYFYRVVNKDTGQTYFTGISSKPLSWTGNIGGIDIPRLVDNYIKSDFVQQNTGEDWADMHSGYCTVDIYNMANTDGVVDATFKYWNDWSRFERKYDYTRSLNDPINGKGSNNMIIPFCVYYDDEATFTIVDTKKNGNINTYTLSSPSSPFMMRYNSYYDIKKVEYKKDDDVLFSYDMNHCGPGAFIYRNRFGGWDSFLIEGNISKTDNYTKQNYRIKGEYNQEYVINTLKYIDEKRTDSIDIDTTYEASTGWLTDEESERLVFHLLSSPIVYFQNLHKENQLYDTDSLDIIPVRITASSSEYKKFRNGRRLVNYLITFEKCNIEKVRQ